MRVISLTLSTLLSVLMMHCIEPEELVRESEDGYFPMNENSEWTYLRENTAAGDPALGSGDTIKNFIKGDTVIEGLKYKIVVDENGFLVKVIRKKDGKYYGRHHELYGTFTKEYLFLDENASVNTVWRHYKNNNTTLTEYKVTALNSSRTFNNIEYDSVIEMEVNYYYKDMDDFVLSYSTLHYYAKGVGEIYTYYPYPSMGFGDLYISLLNFKP